MLSSLLLGFLAGEIEIGAVSGSISSSVSYSLALLSSSEVLIVSILSKPSICAMFDDLLD